MGESYAAGKYGVIERKYFGLTVKAGGDAASGFTFNETEAVKVTRWYPKGPITVVKAGVLTLASLGKGEQAFGIRKNGSTRVATVTASTSSAPWAIASDVSPASANVAAGSYLDIIASTNVCSTGTCAVFIDFVRRFDPGGRWDATP